MAPTKKTPAPDEQPKKRARAGRSTRGKARAASGEGPATRKRTPRKAAASQEASPRAPSGGGTSARGRARRGSTASGGRAKVLRRRAAPDPSPRRQADAIRSEEASPPLPQERPRAAAEDLRPLPRATRTPQAAEVPAPAAIPPLPEEEDDEALIPLPLGGELPAREPAADATPRERLEGVRRGELHVSALNRLDDEAVLLLARGEGVVPRPGERRAETLYRLLQAPAARPALTSTFVEGLLELHPDGYGFLRQPDRSYVQHPQDVYVAAGLVRRLRLRPGHWVSGTARPSRPGEHLLALHHVEEVNHEDPATLLGRTEFEDLTVVYPDTRFILETTAEEIEMRVMDLFCPLGRGQRAIITSPPRAGKTILLQKLADAIAQNSPNVDIVVLLVDERPEEVTNMRRSVRGEVISSTFDRPAANHVRLAELVMEKVKRMVEFGRNVVLLLDSITRLGRAYNNLAGPSGRILTGGLEAKALTKPKRFFGAARNIEDGGSLTIVATALVDTGSRMDDVIFEEFKGSGNMELVLDRTIANQRIWPAVNLTSSGTRNEDLLLHPEELRRVNVLRRAISAHSPPGAMEAVLDLMKQYRTNAELLMSLG